MQRRTKFTAREIAACPVAQGEDCDEVRRIGKERWSLAERRAIDSRRMALNRLPVFGDPLWGREPGVERRG